MNKNQVQLLKRAVIMAWTDINVPIAMYEQLIDLLETAMSSEEFTSFLKAHCQEH